MVTIRCTSKTAADLAARMLGGDANPSAISDALGELCNMVAGNFKSKVSTLADHCMLSVPTVIWGEDYVMQTVQPHSGFHVLLSYQGDPIWFSLVIHASSSLSTFAIAPAGIAPFFISGNPCRFFIFSSRYARHRSFATVVL